MDERPNSPVGHYLKLYELQKECLDRRIGIEWKVAIAFWTAIGVVTAFLFQKIKIPNSSWCFFSLLFVVFTLWPGKVWYANQKDKNWMHVYRSNAEKALGLQNDVKTYKEPCKFGWWRDLWLLTEIAITFLFLFASWYLLHH